MDRKKQLKEIIKKLEEIKAEFAEFADDCEANENDQTYELIDEAAAAIDDAIDCMMDMEEI